MKYFFLLAFLFSCGTKKIAPHETQQTDLLQTLKDAHSQWLSEAEEAFDKATGWPSATDCDGTLWASLAYAGGVKSVQWKLAEYAPGEIHRRPTPSCWNGADNGSQTTISRDMLLGYLWALWAAQDGSSADALAQFGEEHTWKMGEPLADGRVLFTPNMQGLLGRMLRKLTGADKFYRHFPPVYTYVGKDYEQHLVALSASLDAVMDEEQIFHTDISKTALDLIREFSGEHPENAFFKAVVVKYESGDYSDSIKTLFGDGVPSYVRGHKNYTLVYKIFTGKFIITQYK